MICSVVFLLAPLTERSDIVFVVSATCDADLLTAPVRSDKLARPAVASAVTAAEILPSPWSGGALEDWHCSVIVVLELTVAGETVVIDRLLVRRRLVVT